LTQEQADQIAHALLDIIEKELSDNDVNLARLEAKI
tara:strand:+ start:852 stop:959 length:108 start_codon:yes stop_codon:yes gene_type:complete